MTDSKIDNITDNNFIQAEKTPEQTLEQSELEEKAVLTTTDEKADEKTFVHVPTEDSFLWIGQSTSFQEVDRLETAQEQTDKVNKTTSVFRGLVDNILLFADPDDRSTLLKNVVEGFSNRLTIALSGFKQKDDAPLEVSPFMVYKENGQWRWFSTYSNNIRDDDIPPEIISKASHRRFVDMVDKGETPLPALWLWHMKDLVIGQTDVVAFDDETGIAMAAGHFFPSADSIAETIKSNPDDWGVSHGMPSLSIARNKDDHTIIEEHITQEISPLPRGREANRWADFIALKEANMGLTPEKLNQLDELGIGEKIIANVQANNQELSKAADEAKLERKEADELPAAPDPVEAPIVEPVATPVAEPIPVPVETPDSVEVETPAEIPVEEPAVETPAPAEPVAPVTPPFSDEQTKELVNAFTTLANDILKAVEAKLDEKLVPILEAKAASDQVANEFLQQTPAASLQDAIVNKEYLVSHSATGREETAVDKRTALSKDAPAETGSNEHIINSGNPLLDQLATDIVGGEQLEEFRQPQPA